MLAKHSSVAQSDSLTGVWSIVLNWHQTEATIVCLDALLASVPGLDPARVIVVDNESREAALACMRRAFPDIVLLPQTRNLGFSGGMNIGIRYALEHDAWAVFLLNNDALVAPDALMELVATLRGRQDLGIVSAKVFQMDDPQRFWAAGAQFTGRRVCHLGAGELDAGQYDVHPPEIVYVCAALVRGSLLRMLGGFDERYFMYYEDIDLNLRARSAGYAATLAPAAHVWHHDALSTRALPEQRLFYEACSRQRFFARHLRGHHRLRFYPAELRYGLALVLRYLRRGRLRSAAAYLWGSVAAVQRQPSLPLWLRR